MAVKLQLKLNKSDIKKLLQQRKERIEQALLLRLQRIGEEFVTNARDNATFTDRTGNLRSSIGYVILKDGKQIFSDFQRFPKAKGVKKPAGKSGVTAAKEVINEAKANFSTGIVLIGVAGMDYAAAVESKGYDVITASSILAENSLTKAVKTIDSKAGAL
jgi:hypothetical protein